MPRSRSEGLDRVAVEHSLGIFVREARLVCSSLCSLRRKENFLRGRSFRKTSVCFPSGASPARPLEPPAFLVGSGAACQKGTLHSDEEHRAGYCQSTVV